MVKSESEPIPESELEEETDIEEEIQKFQYGEQRSHRKEQDAKNKDGIGQGDLHGLQAYPDQVNYDAETYVGKPANEKDKEDEDDKNKSSRETYIQENRMKNSMSHTDQNKVIHTRVGDLINYYQNGVQDSGVVAKMANSYITIFKEDGTFHDVHINDTFFVSDILINKTWNDMSLEEKTTTLIDAKAYSPMFLNKTWEDLPKELQTVLQTKVKSDQEQSTHGNAGGNPSAGVSTETELDAPEDYEGQSHEVNNDNFKYEDKQPEEDKHDEDVVHSDPIKVDTKIDKNFVYTDKPTQYKTKGWGMKYGVKYINDKEDN